MQLVYFLPKVKQCGVLPGVSKNGFPDEKEIPGVIEDMQSDGRIYGCKAVSYKTEAEGRGKHEQRPRDGMAGQMGQCE